MLCSSEGLKAERWVTVRTEVNVKAFTRISVDPNQMGGLPCIRGLRIPVATVVGMVSEGMTEAEILNAYPPLQVVLEIPDRQRPVTFHR